MSIIKKQDRGFSLVEVSVALLILGIMTAPLINMYRIYKAQRDHNKTELAVSNVSSALAEFYTINGYYPCPADPRLGPADDNHGNEQCTDDWGGSVPGYNFKENGAASLTEPDMDEDGNQDFIKTGSVPYQTLGISVQESIDGYGSKLFYAVSENMTTPNALSVQPNYGVIQAIEAVYDDSVPGYIDRAVVALRPVDTVPPIDLTLGFVNDVDSDGVPDNGMLDAVVLSHGPDRRGAYSLSGNGPNPCNAADGSDAENCDGDAFFYDNIVYEAPGATYFDDTVSTKIWSFQSLWAVVPGDDDNIRNTNPGNVGINVDDPQDALHVVGNIKVDHIKTGIVCRDGSDGEMRCFEPRQIGGIYWPDGNGMRCNNGTVMQGISNGGPECTSASLVPPVMYEESCGLDSDGSQLFLTGFDADGDIICDKP